MYLRENHKIAIHPDKLIETINYLNEYFKAISPYTHGEINIEFRLPLKQFDENMHTITIKGDVATIERFIKDEFLKKQNG